MSRKPIELEFMALKTPRERVWEVIVKLGSIAGATFDKRAVRRLCLPVVTQSLVNDYINALEKAGYLNKPFATDVDIDSIDAPIQYALVKHQGIAPRITIKGDKVTQGAGTEAMWRCMKVLPVFDYTDIAKAATLGSLVVKPSTAKEYVGHLARAGYLSTVRKSKPGTPAKHRLSNNTGMHAPAITRMKAVFDRNTGKSTPVNTAQEVCDGLE